MTIGKKRSIHTGSKYTGTYIHTTMYIIVFDDLLTIYMEANLLYIIYPPLFKRLFNDIIIPYMTQ